MSSTLKSTNDQKHESFVRRKLLEEHIISLPENPNLVRLYTDLKEYLFSQIIMSKETLGKEWEKNPEVVWNWGFKLMSTYDYYTINCNKLEK